MPPLRKIEIGVRAAERDESEVRWLISYSDFMMQLVCLFILLYSVSALDKGRMARVASAYRASIGMGEPPAATLRSSGDKLAIGDRSPIGGELGSAADLPRGLRYEVEPFAGGFRLVFDEAIFEAGSAQPSAKGKDALDAAARVLRAYVGAITVTGQDESLPLALARAEAAIAHLTRAGFARALDPRFVAASGEAGPGRLLIRMRAD